MQKFNINVPAVAYYIAAKCFSDFFKADADLLNLIENSAREFLFTPAACCIEKEGGIIGRFRIDSTNFPTIEIRSREIGSILVGEVDLRKALPEKGIKEPYICFYLPERKIEAKERSFLFSSNEEDLNLLKELAFPFAGD
jgi:hypothetical protein